MVQGSLFEGCFSVFSAKYTGVVLQSGKMVGQHDNIKTYGAPPLAWLTWYNPEKLIPLGNS